MNRREFGNPQDAEWDQKTLGDAAEILESLCERECEYMETARAKMYGGGVLNVRLDLVEKARELIEVADAGNPKIMRATWRKVCKR